MDSDEDFVHEYDESIHLVHDWTAPQHATPRHVGAYIFRLYELYFLGISLSSASTPSASKEDDDATPVPPLSSEVANNTKEGPTSEAEGMRDMSSLSTIIRSCRRRSSCYFDEHIPREYALQAANLLVNVSGDVFSTAYSVTAIRSNIFPLTAERFWWLCAALQLVLQVERHVTLPIVALHGIAARFVQTRGCARRLCPLVLSEFVSVRQQCFRMIMRRFPDFQLAAHVQHTRTIIAPLSKAGAPPSNNGVLMRALVGDCWSLWFPPPSSVNADGTLTYVQCTLYQTFRLRDDVGTSYDERDAAQDQRIAARQNAYDRLHEIANAWSVQGNRWLTRLDWLLDVVMGPLPQGSKYTALQEMYFQNAKMRRPPPHAASGDMSASCSKETLSLRQHTVLENLSRLLYVLYSSTVPMLTAITFLHIAQDFSWWSDSGSSSSSFGSVASFRQEQALQWFQTLFWVDEGRAQELLQGFTIAAEAAWLLEAHLLLLLPGHAETSTCQASATFPEALLDITPTMTTAAWRLLLEDYHESPIGLLLGLNSQFSSASRSWSGAKQRRDLALSRSATTPRILTLSQRDRSWKCPHCPPAPVPTPHSRAPRTRRTRFRSEALLALHFREEHYQQQQQLFLSSVASSQLRSPPHEAGAPSTKAEGHSSTGARGSAGPIKRCRSEDDPDVVLTNEQDIDEEEPRRCDDEGLVVPDAFLSWQTVDLGDDEEDHDVVLDYVVIDEDERSLRERAVQLAIASSCE